MSPIQPPQDSPPKRTSGLCDTAPQSPPSTGYNPHQALIGSQDHPSALPLPRNTVRADLSAIKKNSHLRPARAKKPSPYRPLDYETLISLKEMTEFILTLQNQTAQKEQAPDTASQAKQSEQLIQPENSPKAAPVLTAVPQRNTFTNPSSSLPYHDEWRLNHHQKDLPKQGIPDRTTSNILWFCTLLISGILGYGTMLILSQDNLPKSISSNTQEQPSGEDSLTPLERDALITNAMGTAQNFLEAGSLEGLLQYVRQPERTRSQLTPHYQQLTFAKMGTPISLKVKTLGSIEQMSAFVCSYQTADMHQTHHLCLIEEEHGEFRVDWQSFVGYSERRWTQLTKERPSGDILLRTTCKEDHFYPAPYSDKHWRCIRLQNPNEDETLFAYVEKGTDLEKKLSRILAHSLDTKHKLVTATIKVNYPEKGGANHVLLSNIVGRGWVH